MDLTKVTKGKVKALKNYYSKLENALDKYSIQDLNRISESGEWWFLREGKSYYVDPNKQVIDLGLEFEELPETITEEREGNPVKMSVFLNVIQTLERIKGELIEECLLLVDPEATYEGVTKDSGFTYHVYTLPDNSGQVWVGSDEEIEDKFVPM